MASNAYLARQAILDKNGEIFAYELLFRNSPESTNAVIQSEISATAIVLENALNNIGLPALLGNTKGFINCSREMLLGKMTALLEKNRFVLEILESVLPDESVIEAVSHLHAQGFTFALDDFVFNKKNCEIFAPYFPYLSYVKIDIAENAPEARRKAVLYFKEKNIKVLAEKVETETEAKACKAEGFDFYQGFYFKRPEILIGTQNQAEIISILYMLRFLRLHPPFRILCKEVAKYPEIEKSLIQYVISDSMYFKHTVPSIEDALEWIGLRNIHEWLMLLLYSRMAFNDTPKKSFFKTTSHKAKFTENIATILKPNNKTFSANAFLLGILSQIKSATTITEILKNLKITHILEEALINHKGIYGKILELVEYKEQENTEKLNPLLRELSISLKDLQKCEKESLQWAIAKK